MTVKVIRNGQEVSGDPHAFEFGDQFAPRPEVQAAPAVVPEPERVTVRKNAAPKKTDQPYSAKQVLRDLKARLRYVEREIKLRQSLEAEREQIQRLIKAAKQEKAVVHALKRATAS